MATDGEHVGIEVEGYVETLKFTSRNKTILSLYEQLVYYEGEAAKSKQIESLVIIVNDQDIRGSSSYTSEDESARASEQALDAVRQAEAGLDDASLPDVYQLSDQDEDEEQEYRTKKSGKKRK